MKSKPHETGLNDKMISIYNRVLQSLKTRFVSASMREVIKPVHFNNSVAQENILVQLNKGTFQVGNEYKQIPEGTFYFIPASQVFNVKFGKASDYVNKTMDEYANLDEMAKSLNVVSGFSDPAEMKNRMSVIRFDTMLHDVVCVFSILDVQPFQIPYDEELAFLVKHICLEYEQDKIGRIQLIENYLQEIIIQIFRFMNSQPALQKNIQKVEYLLDKRLVDVVQFIQNNLEKDLSNKTIAEIAYVSEDYVGQFFKSITNRNLQEYVEMQRLDKAKSMLHTTALSVQEISHRVGFKDPAYFSRRFKMKFGENANTVRQAS